MKKPYRHNKDDAFSDQTAGEATSSRPGCIGVDSESFTPVSSKQPPKNRVLPAARSMSAASTNGTASTGSTVSTGSTAFVNSTTRAKASAKSAMAAILWLMLLTVVLGCSSDGTELTTVDGDLQATVEPTETSPPTALPTATAIPTATPLPTATAVVATPTPTATAIPTSTPLPSATPTPTATAIVAATPLPTATPTVKAEGSEGSGKPEASPEPSATPTHEANNGEGSEPSATPTAQPSENTYPQPTPSISESGDTTLLNPEYAGEVKAVFLPNGLVLPVRAGGPGDWEIITPCFNVARVKNATPIEADIDVLIDPGHGGKETGAVGPNGLVEAEINLVVSRLLRQELQNRGISAELTRWVDERVSIQTRGDLATAIAPKVFISVHHNGGDTEAFEQIGTEVFTQHENAASTRLGALVFEEITNEFADIDIAWVGNKIANGSAWRLNQQGTDLYGVLRRTPTVVSILTEAMYLTNTAEAQLLADPAIAKREAQAIARAVERYFRTTDSGSGTIEGIVFKGDLGNSGGTEGCTDPKLD